MFLSRLQSKTVLLNRGGAPPQGGVIKFQGGARPPCALRNMDSFINKLTDKYICLHKFFVFKGAWHKGQLLKGGAVEKR